MADLDQIRRDRGRIYGDPRENHKGIASQWAPLLQPFARWIMEGVPIPEHVVALMMVQLKTNRMRRVYHEDNYDDLNVYLGFAADWQRDFEYEPVPPQPHHRIYVAGPYSADTEDGVKANVQRAAHIAAELMKKGHDAHCPHAATDVVAKMLADDGLWYERWMRLDMSLIRCWATAIFYEPSPGADREEELARDLGLTVFTSLDEVPDVNP